MKRILFIVSHFGSNADELSDSFNNNSRIQMFNTKSDYTSIEDIMRLVNIKHKLSNDAAIYGDTLLTDISFSFKPSFKFAKFIYLIRRAKPSLSDLIKSGYSATNAYRYYSFRLRRICEMAKNTPNALFLTWDNLFEGKGLDLITDYLDLKESVTFAPNTFSEQNVNDVPYDLVVKGDDCYERHLYFMKNLPLLRV